jgi:hypothetical protein
MFGYKGNNNSGQMPKQPHTMITPQNYGYSHVFLDDDSKFVLELEKRGNIPTKEIADNIKSTANQRTKEAVMWKQIEKDLGKLSKANAAIAKHSTGAKLTVAQNSKRQYDSVSNMFNGMDKLQSDYDLSKARRNQRIAEIKSSYQDSVANLRSNSNSRQRAAAANRN